MSPPIVGVVVAGGLARRMGGGDKCLLPLGGRLLLERVVERTRPQVRHLILNANGDPGRFDRFGLRVVPDTVTGHPGPLAGVLAGMEWALAHAQDCPWVVTFPADTPFLPTDMVEQLFQAASESAAEIAVAASGGRRHHPAALWPVSLAGALRQAIVEEGLRRVETWQARYRVESVAFAGTVDPFMNVNDPADLAQARRLIEGDEP